MNTDKNRKIKILKREEFVKPMEVAGLSFVLSDPGDIESIAQSRRAFENLALLAKEHQEPNLENAAFAVIREIDRISGLTPSEQKTEIEILSKAIGLMQQLVRDGSEIEESAFPSGFFSAPAEGEYSKAVEKIDNIVKDVLHEFVKNRIMKIEELKSSLVMLSNGSEKEYTAKAISQLEEIRLDAGKNSICDVENICNALIKYLKNTEKKDMPLVFKVYDGLYGVLMDLVNKEKEYNAATIICLLNPPEEKIEEAATVEEENSLDIANDPALIKDFINESTEHLDSAEALLIEMETKKGDPEAVNKLFRCFHTMKSLSGFLNLQNIFIVVRELENILSRVRKNELTITPLLFNNLLKSIDLLKTMVKRLSESGKIEVPNEKSFLEKFILHLKESSEGKIVSETTQNHVENKENPACENAPAVKDIKDTIKVDVYRLNRLIDNIGELVIAESQVIQDESILNNASQKSIGNFHQLQKITRELQEIGTSLRMVPVRATFQKMARIVRDISKKTGKEVNFVTSGEETELDRSLVEVISDPLVHMIRNSIDHGVENNREDRINIGKNPIATVKLNAYHKGGNFCVDISDDGRGLDRDAIVKKAVESNIIKDTAGMSERDIYNLIFMPGFSTAKTVTDISGRGVGMDVVKKNVDSMHGNIDIVSEKNKGSTFMIRMPLTMAIIDGMVVTLGSEIFVLPTLSIVELFRPEKKDLNNVLGKGLTVRIRDLLLPLFKLSEMFNIKDAIKEPCEATVLVLEADNKRIGLLVDAVIGQQQVVVKRLELGIGEVIGISGGAVMPDGKVGLILDASGLLKIALGIF
ncbi:MAG: hypothetical protein A2044_03300 [Candidatus Firestonebacteria bacterium GWA2_43_8]|nr:MAG: hypothetical protein A2044_03300 [Candidatus Firestonebacteria bacterium GWA2_43_8]